MKKFLLLIIISLFPAVSAFSQEVDIIDSLKHLAAETCVDTTRARIYVNIAAHSNDPDTILKYSNLAIDIATRHGDLWTIMVGYDNIGWVQYYQYKFEEAIDSYSKSLSIATELDNKHFMGAVSLSMGNVYYELSDIAKMWDAYYRSLDMFTMLSDTANMCIVIRNMGQSFTSLGMYQSAQEQYQKSLGLSTMMNDTAQMAFDHRTIGETYLQQYSEDTTESALQGLQTAKSYLKTAERMIPDVENDYTTAERVSNYISLADCYFQLARRLGNRSYVDSCRHYVELFKKNNLSMQEEYLLASQTEADLLMLEKQYSQAIPILNNALKSAVEDGSLHNEMTISRRLYECYDHVGDKARALDAVVRYYTLKQQVANETEMKRSAEYQAQQQVKIEKERMEADRKVAAAEKRRQKIINYALLVGLMLMTVIVLLVLKAFRQKRRSNAALMEKNAVLEQQKEEIATQNDALREKSEEIASQRDMLAAQKDSLSRTNSQMRDSITYAQRIQRTVISDQEEIDEMFPENFVLYRPRDIVSGDFYRVDNIRDHKVLIVADCTGHGVPGALLSMMGISALKDILRQLEIEGCDVIDPAAILQELREFVKNAFNKSYTDERFATGDGMDMSICVMRPDGVTMDFAGANQSVVVVRNGEAVRLKGDFMPIGNFVRETDFMTQTVTIAPGDMLYMFSDGIQDQLGGPDNGKFSLRRLIERLAELSKCPAGKQMYEIEMTVELWMGQNAQLDDITLLGVRL